MAVGSRPFAYNTGGSIPGTTQIGNLAVGTPTNGFASTGLDWWNGPSESAGYIITRPVPANTQPTPSFSGGLTISTTYKGSSMNLSNNNQTVHQFFGYIQTVLGQTLIDRNDKVMFSISCLLDDPGTFPNSHFLGFGKTSMNYNGVVPDPYNSYPGNDNQSIGFSSGGEYWFNGAIQASGLPTWTSGDTIDVAVDLTNNKVWVRVNGGNWNNNSGENPATGTGSLGIGGLTSFYPALCPAYEGTYTIQNTTPYGVPTGFQFLGANVNASVGFLKSQAKTYASFFTLVNEKFGQSFSSASASDAKAWLNDNGYWTSFVPNGSLNPQGANYVSTSTPLTLGSGNLTVEGWVYMTSNPDTNRFVLVGGSGNRGISIYNGVYVNPNATTITIDYETAGDYQFTLPTTLLANVWYHIAVSRDSSNSMSLWLNGVRAGSPANLAFNFISNNYSIGAWPTQAMYSDSGVFISNIRMTTTNVYDVNSLNITVPTSPLTDITGTQLLMNTNFGGTEEWLVDSSSNNITMVANGVPLISGYEPFTPLP